MKIEIVWPSAIGETKNSENAHLRRHSKHGSDSSVWSKVWPSANGGLNEEQEMPNFNGIRGSALIQAFGSSCGLRPLVNRRKTNIYAAEIDLWFGQEASFKIGLRLG